MQSCIKAFLLASLLFLASCTTVTTNTIVPKPTAKEYSHRELLEALKSRSEMIDSIEGRINSKIIVNGDSNSSKQLVVFKKPSYMRLDILTPFGSPALTMATDGDFLDLQYHSENRFFSGPANGRTLSGLLSSSLSIKDLSKILSGSIPLITFDEDKSVVKVEKEGYRLILQNSLVRQEILLENNNLYPIEGAIFDAQNKIVVTIKMDDYEKIKDIDFPKSIDFSTPLENYEMKIDYLDVALNEYTGMNAFQLIPPEGTQVENLGRLSF